MTTLTANGTATATLHAPPRATAVYVSHAGSGDVHVLHLDPASGALTPVQRLDLGGVLMPMALVPGAHGRAPRHRLYVARRSPPESVHTLAIDARDGRLVPLAEHPLPASMCWLSADRSGRMLLAASFGSGVVAVIPLDADGIALPPSQVLPAGSKAHCIRVDAANRFAWSTSLGDGALLQWRFDADAGKLAPNTPAVLPLRPGAGPRHLELHPNGRFAYLLNELDATVDVLAVDAATGTLSASGTVSARPDGFSGEPWAADLHLTPDARWLCFSERRSSTIAVLRVDAGGALLHPVGHVPVQAEPRGFHIEAGGRFLLVAGQASNHVGVHAIDAALGTLARVHEQPVGAGPNWIETLPLEPAAPEGDTR